MPRDLVLHHLGSADPADSAVVWAVAEALHVSESALIEHLYNLRIIDESGREALRPLFRPAGRA